MKYLLLLCLVIYSFQLDAQATTRQEADSIKRQHSFAKSTIVPATLLSAGLILNNSKFEKQLRDDLRAQLGQDFEIKIDDYFQYVPVAQMYLADAFQLKAKNHWFDQSKYLFISNVISTAITQSLKRITSKTRPDGSTTDAFPSGHTTFAFTNASVLMHEFKDTAPVLAYSGYFFSTTTGAFRIMNDRHWLSDMLVGASIGILAAELVYMWQPLKNFNPFKNNKNINFVPVLDQNSYGFHFSYSF